MENYPKSGPFRLSASAGSGKTYALTNLYVKSALQFPDAFKGIIAITFTNKAAGELRDRIVKKLQILATSKIEPKELEFFEFSDSQKLNSSATSILNKILHNYDFFQVTTIDSFFQTLFSQLAFEANLPPGLKIELDQSKVSDEVLEEGLKDIHEELKSILLENLIQKLKEKGTGWRPSSYLTKSLKESLFAPQVLEFYYSDISSMLDDNHILLARKNMSDYLILEQEKAKNIATDLLKTCSQYGISIERYSIEDADFISELKKIQAIANGDQIPEKVYKSYAKGKFFKKSTGNPIPVATQDLIAPILIAYYEFFNPNWLANLNLAKELVKHLSAIRLLLYFRNVLKSRNGRKNSFLLAETKYILKGLIGDTDIPYIYERLGNQTHTLLIDEFQDTDLIQWKVIEPLAKAIVDKNGFFAVVGDVKQSIYGWRGADSSLFKKGLNAGMLPLEVVEQTLDTNYRSHFEIVSFNNFIFENLAKIFPAELENSNQVSALASWEETIRMNYKDVIQQVSDGKKPGLGFVDLRARARKKISNIELEDSQDEEDGEDPNWIVEEIIKIQKAGIEANEIAILVRNGANLAHFARILDKERNRPGQKYDFRFSTSGSEVNEGQFVLEFLALGLTNVFKFEDFLVTKMTELARYIGLEPVFWNYAPGEKLEWVTNWKNQDWIEGDKGLFSVYQKIISFFRLNQLSEHQQALIYFQNLIYQFEQQDFFEASDFFKWWNEKISIQKLETPNSDNGIQLMTIHKAKGLDFGVVILALDSTSKGDDLHNFDYWINSGDNPWNLFPLLKVKANRKWLDSDIGSDYSAQVYRQAIENLNLWYVACTRPRYGLIIDITLDTDLNPPKTSQTKLSRLTYQIPRFFKDNHELIKDRFPGSELQIDVGEFLLRFQNGEIQKIFEVKKAEANAEVLLDLQFSKMHATQWLPMEKQSPEIAFGLAFHQILEKTNFAKDWENVFGLYSVTQSLSSDIKAKLHQSLRLFFENETIKNWFSNTYVSYNEMEFLQHGNEVLRADRVLEKNGQIIVLDFKTGDESEKHQLQLSRYMAVLKFFFQEPIEGYLVYVDSGIKIISVTEP